MDRRCSRQINIMATGFIVLVLYSLVLFWGRYICWKGLIDNMPAGSRRITISPSRLVPGEPAPQQVEPQNRSATLQPGPNEPNLQFSEVSCDIYPTFVFMEAIGAFWDVKAKVRLPYDVNEKIYYRYKDKDNYLCLDKRSGLLINHQEYKAREPNGELITRASALFAGPNGVSLTAEPSLGRFHDPLIGGAKDSGADRFWLYERENRQFYFVDFVEGVVKKGLQLEKADSREPVAIETIGTWPYYGGGGMWSPPMVWNADNNEWEDQRVFLPGDLQSGKGRFCWTDDWTHTYFPVLDKTGRIFIYNSKEQTLASVGYLPMPTSLFGSERLDARPKDVLVYKVVPVYANLRSPDEPNKPRQVLDVKYLGMNVFCVSREGTAMTMAVFDANGRQIYRGDTTSNGISTAKAVYSDSAGATLPTTILFLLENLQPAVFGAVSYLCGDYFEASAGHRALFVLPNSFVGMLGRGTGLRLIEMKSMAFLMIAPSLFLSIWLAARVRKDAVLVGFSSEARTWWLVGTIAFGLPAYITYRLTRHKEVLVTCRNCGKLRRPDMEKCHHCGSKWEMPELTPPNWRICD